METIPNSSTVLDATQITWEARRTEAKELVERAIARGVEPIDAMRLARTAIKSAQRAHVIHRAELAAARPAFAQTA